MLNCYVSNWYFIEFLQGLFRAHITLKQELLHQFLTRSLQISTCQVYCFLIQYVYPVYACACVCECVPVSVHGHKCTLTQITNAYQPAELQTHSVSSTVVI